MGEGRLFFLDEFWLVSTWMDIPELFLPFLWGMHIKGAINGRATCNLVCLSYFPFAVG